ncbi:MAG: FAD-linked oxidase C-terminal domain-containing protein, partial [Pseudomonadota bacterium]
TMPQVRQPFAEIPGWLVLIDLGLTEAAAPSAVLERLFERAFDAGLAVDGVVAQSEGQRQDFWTIRESIPAANRLVGAISSHDISLPLSAVPEFIATAGAALAAEGAFRINCFGHLGDGNLHYNVFPLKGQSKADRAHEKASVQDLVHAKVAEMDGSISAEHGIGRLKVGDLERFGDPTKLAAMRAIKTALDPVGIMNPGAVLRM